MVENPNYLYRTQLICTIEKYLKKIKPSNIDENNVDKRFIRFNDLAKLTFTFDEKKKYNNNYKKLRTRFVWTVFFFFFKLVLESNMYDRNDT